MKWHPEALTPGCRQTAGLLAKSSLLKDFYLAGGTALALMYGHRISVDLDFFSSSHALDFPAKEALLERLQKCSVTIEAEREGTVHARHGMTQVSFFKYRHPLLRKTRFWQGIAIAHPIDIGLMKVAAIIGRGSRKDYIDLYYILQKELRLTQLMRLVLKKFRGRSDILTLAMRSLVYFSDADAEPSPKLITPLPWNEVKGFFEKEVRKLAKF